MIKLSWTAMRCYRRESFVMCFRSSVLLRGRVLEGKGLQWLSCSQAVKMQMPGSTSCYRKRAHGLPLQPGVLLQEEVSEQVFSKERRRLQAKHLWMEVKLQWGVLADRQSPHWEVQRRTRCSAFWQGRQTQPHRPVWRKISSWCWNQRSLSMVEEM